MTEIARLAQVSQPTVSRVLNGSTTVSPEIRERVLAFAQAHDYQFNALAKGLQGSKTNLLGVILKDISNGFFADLAKAIEARAKERGYSIILFNSDHNPQQQRENMDMVRRYRVDGMLITPTLRTPALWRECVNKLEIPTIVITQQVEGVDSVDLDHEEAARQVAHHLAEKDYQRFLFIGKPIDIKYKVFPRNWSPWAYIRPVRWAVLSWNMTRLSSVRSNLTLTLVFAPVSSPIMTCGRCGRCGHSGN